MAKKIQVLVLSNDGVPRYERIRPTYKAVCSLLKVKESEWLKQADISVDGVSYQVFYGDECNYSGKKKPEVIGYNKGRDTFLLGTIVVCRVNKKGNIRSLSSKNRESFEDRICVTRRRRVVINCVEYWVSGIVFIFD